MADQRDIEKKERWRQEKNRLTLFTFTAACAGFVLALYLGAFSEAFLSAEFRETPPWISAFAAVVATGISVLAVYLVYRTLGATVATLDITQQMYRAQKETFDIEFRPQVLADEVKVVSVNSKDADEVDLAIKFTFRNYGKLAALRLEGSIFAGNVRANEVINLESYTGFMGYSLFQKSVLRPDAYFTQTVVISGNFTGGKSKLLSSQILFYDEKGQIHTEHEKTYYFIEHAGRSFAIREAGPFDFEDGTFEDD